MLFCTVVVADEGAHSLHDAVGGQIEESLELIVDAQHHHIALGEGRQQAVEEGDQQGGQGQIQDGRHTDGVETASRERSGCRAFRRRWTGDSVVL